MQTCADTDNVHATILAELISSFACEGCQGLYSCLFLLMPLVMCMIRFAGVFYVVLTSSTLRCVGNNTDITDVVNMSVRLI